MRAFTIGFSTFEFTGKATYTSLIVKIIEKQMDQLGIEGKEELKKNLPHEDPESKRLRAAIKAEEDKLKAMMDGTSSCTALDFQRNRIYTAKEAYCTNLSPSFLEALNGYRTAIVTSLPDAEEMEKTQMEIQKVQFGVDVPPEQADMAGLGLVRDYINKLRSSTTM